MDMEKINYQKMLEKTLAQLAGTRPRLLLHACCAPCSSAVLELLCAHFDLTLYYYNPNIAPVSEYDARARELERLAAVLPQAAGRVPVWIGPYDNQQFEALARGLDEEPEGGARCLACYRIRLMETARLAGEKGFDYYTTTLSISPHKNAAALCRIGLETQCAAGGAQFLCADFKKGGGFTRSCALSAQYGLYRQDYCGCRFSRRARAAQSEPPQAAKPESGQEPALPQRR